MFGSAYWKAKGCIAGVPRGVKVERQCTMCGRPVFSGKVCTECGWPLCREETCTEHRDRPPGQLRVGT